MKYNTYFDEMYRIGHEWSEKHDAHEKLKEEIIKTRGWDSPELEAWYPQGGDAERHEFLQTRSCAQENAGCRASQRCWEDEQVSRNVYFVHKINAVLNYYEQTSSRVILEVI